MIELTKLQIKNFRNHSDSIIKFGKTNVLSGDNFAGKSSIIDAINLALTSKVTNGSAEKCRNIYADSASVNLEMKIGGKLRETTKTIENDSVKTSLLTISNINSQANTTSDTLRSILDNNYFLEQASDVSKKNALSKLLSVKFSKEEFTKIILEYIPEEHKSFITALIETKFDDLDDKKKNQLEKFNALLIANLKTYKQQLTITETNLNDEKFNILGKKTVEATDETIANTITYNSKKESLKDAEQDLINTENEIEKYTTKILESNKLYESLNSKIGTVVTKEEIKELEDKKAIVNFQLKEIEDSLNSDLTGECTKCGNSLENAKLYLTKKQSKLKEDMESICSDLYHKVEMYELLEKAKNIKSIIKLAQDKQVVYTAETIKIKEIIAAKKAELEEIYKKGIIEDSIDILKNHELQRKLKLEQTLLINDKEKYTIEISKYNDIIDALKNDNLKNKFFATKKDEFTKKFTEIVSALLPTKHGEINEDGEIHISSIPSECLSKSEKCRVAIALQVALSITSGIGLVIIDGLDIISNDTEAISIIEKLHKIENLQTVITSSDKYTGLTKDIKYAIIANGRVIQEDDGKI